MDIFSQLASSIIKEQETIIGPVAIEQAQKVSGLTIDSATRSVSLSGNKTEVIEQLIEKYRDLFGMASVEVCRDAVRSLLPKVPKDQLPTLLQ
jgi:hypothetical protein